MSDLTAEDREAIEQLDKEVYLLVQAADDYGDEMDPEYAKKIMRNQIEQIGNLTEVLASSVGPGDMESVAKPSEIGGDSDGN